MKKTYTEKEIMQEYKSLDDMKKIKILNKALKLAIENRAGTKEYAIAHSMNYKYEDDGSYTKC